MYIYFNKSYEATTVIPHGEILRQGGDLNLYVCLDEKLEYNTSFICTIDMNGEKTPLVYIEDGYFTFNKIKDSEITYDLIDGKKYWRLYFKATPEVATVYSGKINVSFEINKPDGKNYSATIPLYVEKTFGYSLDKTNLSKDEYAKLWELINTINGTKISYSNGIVTKNKTEKFNENDVNKLFIDEKAGDIFTVEGQNENFVVKIINFGEKALDDFLNEKYQFDTEPTPNSGNLLTSGTIYDALGEIPYVEPVLEDGLTGIKIDGKEFEIPNVDLELIKNSDGKLTEIRIDGNRYKVDILENLEKSVKPTYFDSKPITSGGVYEALQEKSKVEFSKDGRYLKEINVDGDTAEIPLVDFEILETTPNEGKEIKGFKFNGQTYIVTGVGGSLITVDKGLSSSSKNPVENRVIYNALETKVPKVNGKGLSTNDYTTAEKNKLAGLSNYNDTDLRNLISTAQSTANEAKSIAQGRSTSYTFETLADLKNSLYTKGKYIVGDNLYIKEKNVPDYWIYNVYSTSITDNSTGRYGYYMIAELETQKVDLADYPTTDDMNTAINNAIGVVLNTDVEE